MANLGKIPKGDPNLTTYPNELLRMNEPEQQNNLFCFPTTENLGKIGDHTHMQIRILRECLEIKEKEKFDPQDDTEFQIIFLERFDWTKKLLTEAEKQAKDDILGVYPNIFPSHSMDIGITREFKLKLAPKDNKAVYNQSLPMPIHLEGYLIVELAPISNAPI